MCAEERSNKTNVVGRSIMKAESTEGSDRSRCASKQMECGEFMYFVLRRELGAGDQNSHKETGLSCRC